MIYVYAIVDRPDRPLPSQLGLHDQQLSKFVCDDIVAVVSDHDGAPPAATADAVWRHEAVLEALMRDRTVLPMRFGTLLRSSRQLDEILRHARRTLARDMDRVRGHVEIGMRVLSMPDADATIDGSLAASGPLPPPCSGSGTAYLQAKRDRARELRVRRQKTVERVQSVYDLLAAHASEGRLDAEADNSPAVSAAFLVARDRLADFRALVGEVAAAHPELALLCTGPWPPYSFVNAVGHAANGSEVKHAI